MSKGLISAGNSREIAKRIDRDDWKSVALALSKAGSLAERKQCNRILLSSEWLLAALAKKNRVSLFAEEARRSGISELSFLLVLRDPISQFLSLYKHRAKSGTSGTIAGWAERGYELPALLKAFREQISQHSHRLTVQRYCKDSRRLTHSFFETWLDIPSPGIGSSKSVNPSLSLSELELIRILAKTRPQLAQYFYDKLLMIPVDQKVQGQAIENYSQKLAQNAVSRYAEEWGVWNSWLPVDDQLEIPASTKVDSLPPNEFGFSQAQLSAFADIVAESSGLQFLLKHSWPSTLRLLLRRLRSFAGV